jgi:hypothetical protein
MYDTIPRLAIGYMKHRIGLLVIGKLLGMGIPG